MIYTRVWLLLALISSAYGHKKFKKDKDQHDKDVGIIGGHEISIKLAPFMASVRLNGSFHWCGGSIIHERFILTAAHCVVPNIGLTVLVGTDKIDEGGKLYDVEKIIIHEDYSNKTNDYDVCLLKLNESLTFGPTVQRVLLKGNGNLVKLRVGTLLNATGWGYTHPQKYSVSRHLQQVAVPVVSMASCRLYHKHRNITARMLCAGAVGKDSCAGDSGGPLTWNNIQIGIVSYNTGCGVIPRIYTRIKIVKPWIRDMIKHHNHKKEKRSQKTKREKRQKPKREMSPIAKKLFKRALQ